MLVGRSALAAMARFGSFLLVVRDDRLSPPRPSRLGKGDLPLRGGAEDPRVLVVDPLDRRLQGFEIQIADDSDRVRDPSHAPRLPRLEGRGRIPQGDSVPFRANLAESRAPDLQGLACHCGPPRAGKDLAVHCHDAPQCFAPCLRPARLGGLGSKTERREAASGSSFGNPDARDLGRMDRRRARGRLAPWPNPARSGASPKSLVGVELLHFRPPSSSASDAGHA
mmetsp:Transcript_23113/g.40936  ORF Transcript_23113/g.40936 Transcript_23113/m.40936 type:complete len:224 (+) Transcript_23113:677-1348(+)